ncbi:MAG: hypothetical protein AAF604_08185 [Acidobacteriota bacterium]
MTDLQSITVTVSLSHEPRSNNSKRQVSQTRFQSQLFSNVTVRDESDGCRTVIENAAATLEGSGADGSKLIVNAEQNPNLVVNRCYRIQGDPDLDDSARFEDSQDPGVFNFVVDNSSCPGC